MTRPPFEPLEILAVLEKYRVAYVVIGKLAAIIHGTGGITDGLDICPQMKDVNLVRLQKALDELDARTTNGSRAAVDSDVLATEPITRFTSASGEIGIVPDPPGTRGGWDDVRRRASREPLGGGVRAPIAAVEDLIRIEAARDIDADQPTLDTLRLVHENTRGRGLTR